MAGTMGYQIVTVNATVEVEGEAAATAEGGASIVLVTPPSYAPAIENVTTWYDQAVNVAVRKLSSRLIKAVPYVHAGYLPDTEAGGDDLAGWSSRKTAITAQAVISSARDG